MANNKRDTVALIEGIGGVRVAAPRRLLDKHARGDEAFAEGQKLLIAIIDTPFGDHLKEVSYPATLQQIRATPQAVVWMEISQETLRQMESHPRKGDILD